MLNLLPRFRWLAILATGLLLVAPKAEAALIPPAGFGANIGPAAFIASAPIVVVTKGPDALGNSTFGVFGGAPLEAVTLFSGADATGSVVGIDFAAGNVFNPDATVRSTFAPFGLTFGAFQFLTDSSIFLTTTPSLNPGGIDAASVFPSLTDPNTFLVGFEVPIAPGVGLGFILLSGVTVPEPLSWVLVLSFCTMLVVVRGRSRSAGLMS